MSPNAARVLLEDIMPALTRTIPHTVYPTGCEDTAEMIQDGAATAATMLEDAERAGRDLNPSGVIYYTVQRLRSGRRSGGAATGDAMSPLAARMHGFSVVSMDTSMAAAGGDDGDLALADVLACRRDDPGSAASRRVDWDRVLEVLDDREVSILRDIAVGNRMTDTATILKVSAPRITQLKREIAATVRARLGDDILAEIMTEPGWRHDLRSAAEKITLIDAESRLAA